MKKWILGFAVGILVLRPLMAGEPAPAVETTPGQSALHETLVRAIREQRMLHFVYNGHARVVEPHAYGVSATGDKVLHAFQIEGDSASKPPPGWRTFNVALIEDLAVEEQRFTAARPDYARGEPKIETVWAEVGP